MAEAEASPGAEPEAESEAVQAAAAEPEAGSGMETQLPSAPGPEMLQGERSVS